MGDVRAADDRHAQASVGADSGFQQAAAEVNAKLVAERRFADRRLAELARAIREHEGAVRGPAQRSRAHDRRLYTRLREVCGERIGQ